MVKRKTASGPKRAASAYLFFCGNYRASVKKQNPEMKMTDVQKVLGEMWRALDVEAKAPFDMLAKEDKTRYLKEKSKIIASSDSAADCKARPKKEKSKKATGPKRAMSAYIFFCAEHRANLRNANPEMKMTDVQKLLGEMWRELGVEHKAPFDKLAKEDKERYLKEKSEMFKSGGSTAADNTVPKKAAVKKKAAGLKRTAHWDEIACEDPNVDLNLNPINPPSPKKRKRKIADAGAKNTAAKIIAKAKAKAAKITASAKAKAQDKKRKNAEKKKIAVARAKEKKKIADARAKAAQKVKKEKAILIKKEKDAQKKLKGQAQTKKRKALDKNKATAAKRKEMKKASGQGPKAKSKKKHKIKSPWTLVPDNDIETVLKQMKHPTTGSSFAIRCRMLNLVKDTKTCKKITIADMDTLLFYMKQGGVTKGGTKGDKRKNLMNAATNTKLWHSLDDSY